MIKSQVAVVMAREPRMLLKTFRDGGRAGLSSGLIRHGSRASAEHQTRQELQVTDRADLPRTHAHRLGKRVGTCRSRSGPARERKVRNRRYRRQLLTLC